VNGFNDKFNPQALDGTDRLQEIVSAENLDEEMADNDLREQAVVEEQDTLQIEQDLSVDDELLKSLFQDEIMYEFGVDVSPEMEAIEMNVYPS